jgi:hypothetical protein
MRDGTASAGGKASKVTAKEYNLVAIAAVVLHA